MEGVGFEIFDKLDFTMTDFIQRLNYQRAVQGELSRTIKSLPEVESCRVHLVSSSIDGLNPEDVTVVVRVVSKGKVRAKVSAQIDFTKTEKTEEKYDPDSQVVRSEQKVVEKSSRTSPGVSSNIPGKLGTEISAGSYSEKKSETVNYEISKVMSHTIILPGEIKRLTVVALVDGTYSEVEESKEKRYIPRTEEELKKFETMVKNAVGFIAERGDDVRVINMPFQEEDIRKEEIEEPKREIMPVVITGIKYSIPLIAILLLFFIVIRPLIKIFTAPPRAVVKELPKTVAELERQMQLQGISRPDIIEWARANPQKAALFLISLGEDVASEVLKELDPQTVQTLISQMKKLKKVIKTRLTEGRYTHIWKRFFKDGSSEGTWRRKGKSPP